MKKTLFVLLISLPFGEGWGGVLLAQTPDLLVCDDKGYNLTSVNDATGVGTITYKWYENGSDMGSSYNTASISIPATERGVGTYTYVRKASSASCTDVDSNPFVVHVLAQPAKPTVTPTLAAVCFGADVEFTASGGGTGATYSWTGASGAVSGTDNSTYTLSSPAVGPTSQVKATASIFHNISGLTKTCVSVISNDAGTATVKPVPVVTAPDAPYVWCGTTALSAMEVVVTADGSPVTGTATITWYEAATGDDTVTTGASYTPLALPTTLVSYHVGATYDGCPSNGRTEVTATGLNEGSITGAEI
jgi:hypothetical protein